VLKTNAELEMNEKVYLIYHGSGEPCSDNGRDWMADDFKAAGIEVVPARHWEGLDGGTIVVAGLAHYSFIRKLLKESGVDIPSGPEGVIIKWCQYGAQRLLVAAGTDARGLMYALSELGDAARCGGFEALSATPDSIETPDMLTRGADRFVLGPRDNDWYYSEEFWREHIKKLARCRINRFTLITGNDTWYTTPPYPFFIQTPGFEQVEVIGQTTERRDETLRMLRLMSEMCDEYGLEFIFGSWQQLPWTDNQTLRVKNIPPDVEGFTSYASASIRALLLECPHIRGVQFRYNAEAGVNAHMPSDVTEAAHPLDGALGAKSAIEGLAQEAKLEPKKRSFDTAVGFWRKMIDSVASVGRPLKLDMRMKGLTDELVEYGLQSGLEVALATKYWCEHMGSPYPYSVRRSEEDQAIAKHGDGDVNAARRYSFDNVLRKPHAYDMLYRLWNYGSAILFLWGDPAYVRRFSASCEAAHGTGFTFCEPLSLKGGQAIIPGDAWPLHIDERMKAYTCEDDRYWMFYLCFGRVGYSRETSPEVWRRELRLRFGGAWESVERMDRFGSRIMPLVTTAHFPRHPSQHYWPELFPGNALYKENNYVEYNNAFSYATSNPSDEQLFTSVAKAVDAKLAGKPVDAFHPFTVRDWYESLARQIEQASVEAAERGADSAAEWYPTSVDFNMLAGISRYHARMVCAAWYNDLFEKTGDGGAGVKAYEALTAAREVWRTLSDIGSANYYHDLMFDIGTGMRRNGTWADRIPGQLDKDVRTLKDALSKAGIHDVGEGDPLRYCSLADPMTAVARARLTVAGTARAGQPLTVTVQANEFAPFTDVTLYYRHMNHREKYQSLPMTRMGDEWTAEIPADYVQAEWDMVVYCAAHIFGNSTVILPGMGEVEYDFPVKIVRTVE
jgi:hypothetical protein